MMRIYFFIASIVHFTFVSAQGYRITYERDNAMKPLMVQGKPMIFSNFKERLVFRDTLSFCYGIKDDADQMKKKDTLYGEKLIHHGIIYNSNSRVYFSEVAWPAGAKKYLIFGKPAEDIWTFGTETKTILGYECRSALHVDKNNDSVLVWFTPSIPNPFGPNMYFGFSGLVLEVFDQRGGRGLHIIATKIESGPYRVVMPAKGELIASEEYRKLRR